MGYELMVLWKISKAVTPANAGVQSRERSDPWIPAPPIGVEDKLRGNNENGSVTQEPVILKSLWPAFLPES